MMIIVALVAVGAAILWVLAIKIQSVLYYLLAPHGLTGKFLADAFDGAAFRVGGLFTAFGLITLAIFARWP